MLRKILLIFSLLLSVSAVAQSQNHLNGKTINVLGDSYVRNHKRPFSEAWHALVAERNGMTYRNYGRNGSCIAFDRTDEGFGPSMLQRYKEMNDTADYVIVIAGHNDADKVKDNPDSLEMVRSALRQLCEGLIEKYPAARIGFVTPWRVPRPGFDQMIGLIEDVCAQYSIPVLNAAKEGGIFVWSEPFRKIYFQSTKDTAHLNALGHERFYTRGLNFILGL